MNHETDAKELLYNLSNSYLYKDLLNLESVRRPALLSKLLTALALQVTSEVSYNELAQTVGTDNKTVEKYIDLLEKCYIIFKLNGFSRNLRTELKRAKKFYFMIMEYVMLFCKTLHLLLSGRMWGLCGKTSSLVSE